MIVIPNPAPVIPNLLVLVISSAARNLALPLGTGSVRNLNPLLGTISVRNLMISRR